MSLQSPPDHLNDCRCMIKEIAYVTDHSEPNGVAELTVKIVLAYVSNNTIAQRNSRS